MIDFSVLSRIDSLFLSLLFVIVRGGVICSILLSDGSCMMLRCRLCSSVVLTTVALMFFVDFDVLSLSLMFWSSLWLCIFMIDVCCDCSSSRCVCRVLLRAVVWVMRFFCLMMLSIVRVIDLVSGLEMCVV